jgi:DNA-binding NtrC family response regulator
LGDTEILLVQPPSSTVPVRAALADCGWQVRSVPRIADAMTDAIRGSALVGIVAIELPDLEDRAALEEMILDHRMQWIAIVPRELLQSTSLRQLIVEGFYDFHTLPLDVQRLRVVLGHALGKARLAANVTAGGETRPVPGLVGDTAVMRELYRSIEKVARFDAPVLVSGESGTGKEVTARAIHRLSPRSGNPFVAVNCGSLPVNLVHSELFGHEKGSFTGAHQRKIGSIQAAHGGVIFLDEIGDLPLELQASLLRFLQEKTIVRLGSTQPLRIDVRVIAASHVDLREAVRQGRFREDLYYRLNVLHVHLPALRERLDDIPLLARAFFAHAGAQKSAQVTGFSSDALAAMQAYSWPGNVRELMNRVQKAMIMCEKRLIIANDLGLAGELAHSEPASLRAARGRTDRELIEHTLLSNGRNVAAAARQLGVSRTTLYRMLEKLDIDIRAAGLPNGRAWRGMAAQVAKEKGPT